MKKVLSIGVAAAVLAAQSPAYASYFDSFSDTSVISAESAGSFEITSGAGKVGDKVTLDINLVSNPGIISYFLSCEYDQTKLRIVSVESEQLLGPGTDMISGKYDCCPFNITGSAPLSREDITATGRIASVTFEILDGAEGELEVKITNDAENTVNYAFDELKFETNTAVIKVLSGDEPEVSEPATTVITTANNPITTTVASAESVGSFEITSGTGKVGDKVTLDVNLVKNPGIISYFLSCEYDRTKLRIDSVELGQLLGGETDTPSGRYDCYPFNLTGSAPLSRENITATGRIASVTFEILDGAEGNLEVKITSKAENTINIAFEELEFDTNTAVIKVLSDDEPEVTEHVTTTVTTTTNKPATTAVTTKPVTTTELTTTAKPVTTTEVITTTKPVTTTSELLHETVSGDTNNDGIISAADFIKLVQHILNPEIKINSKNSDMNGDGKIDSADVVELKKLFLG